MKTKTVLVVNNTGADLRQFGILDTIIDAFDADRGVKVLSLPEDISDIFAVKVAEAEPRPTLIVEWV